MQNPQQILLVEDEDNIAIAIEVLLGRNGYDILRVKTGSQALPNLRASSPALVILDVSLPEVSGYEICQQIRREPHYDTLPILMMSAHTSPAEQRKGLAMGADAFITKPFATKDLRDTVDRLIEGGHHAH